MTMVCRKSRGLTYKRRILVVGDGKTEENYFDGITCVNPDIVIRSFGAGKTGIGQILKRTRTYMDKLGIDIREGDRVAVVMDLDLRYGTKDVTTMEHECKNAGIELYLSNPCFEVWLLLHFQKFDRPSNPKDLIGFMENVLNGPYVKSKLLKWDEIEVKRAIEFANSLYGKNFTNGECVLRNPSTTLHRLVSSLL